MSTNDKRSLQRYVETCCDDSYNKQLYRLIDTETVKGFIPYLNADEKFIWSGQPKDGLRFDMYYLITSPVGLFFLYFGISSLTQTDEVYFSQIIFILIGSYIIFGRLMVSVMKRRRCRYAITNQRVFIRNGILNRELHCLKMNDFKLINIKVTKNNIGTIKMTKTPTITTLKNPQRVVLQDSFFRFDTIENANDVYKLIQKIQNN